MTSGWRGGFAIMCRRVRQVRLRDDSDHLLILRHTLMNPYLIDLENGISYIAGYFEFLTRHLNALVVSGDDGRR